MTAIAQALSAALLHFIWQGALVAAVLWIALLLLRNRAANERYLASCAAMALMALLPAVTACLVYRRPGAAAISIAISAPLAGAARIARESALPQWIAMSRQWALPVWSVGVLIFALRLALGCRQVAALRRSGTAADGPIMQIASRLAGRMKARGAIRVLISNVAESPSVVGWLRPAILLPAAALAGLEPWQLEAVLAHEIAHIRRHDYLVNLAQTLVETLLFYHPAIWWVSARIRHEREICCDDAAVTACGDAINYARALTRLERLRGMMPRLALESTGGSLRYRIERLAGIKQELGPSKLPGIAALALAVACFAVTVHWAKAQQLMQQPPVPREVGISVSTTGELLHRTRVPYPEAISKNAGEGAVVLEATLDQSGNVADAHVLSGPPELRKTALQSVLQWQFANGWAGETQQVSITFQNSQAVMQQASQLEAAQTRLTETFLDDELRAAKKRGDSEAAEQIQEKANLAREANLLAEARIKQSGQTENQLTQMKLQLAEARLRLNEENPQVTALSAQIDSLNEQIAAFKQANQGRVALVAEPGPTERALELQYTELKQMLAYATKRYSASHPEVVALTSQVEALEKRIHAASFVIAGATLSRIVISGIPDNAKEQLGPRLPLKVGDVLSGESMDKTIAVVREFDARLECRVVANGGEVTLLIIPQGTAWR